MTEIRELLDQLDQAHAAATPGEWWVDGPGARSGEWWIYALGHRFSRREDAAAIVAEHNAIPALVAAVRAVEALADELEREADERDQIANRLPDQPAYHMEINRLVVAAEHQRRCAKQIRRALAALTPEGATNA